MVAMSELNLDDLSEGRIYLDFGDYDEMGNLLVGTMPRRNISSGMGLGVLRRGNGGEHPYFTQVAPSKVEVHPPDYELMYGQTPGPYGGFAVNFASGPYEHSRVGNVRFMGRRLYARFAELVGDDWVFNENYLARKSPLPTGNPVADAEAWMAGARVGGSPPSLWWSQGTRVAPSPPCKPSEANQPSHTYLGRVPLATHLPEGEATSGPGMAWGGERMWLVAEHEGALKVRIRDGGLWFDWQPLPENVAPQGGAAVVSNGSTVEIFARVPDPDHNGDRIYTTQLTSPIDCAPEACTWEAWSAISPSLWTHHAPAATYDDATGDLYLVFTNTNGMASWLRRPDDGDWDSGHATFIPTDAAPAVAWDPGDPDNPEVDPPTLWVVARLSMGEFTGEMYVGRMTKTDHEPPLYVWNFDFVMESLQEQGWCGPENEDDEFAWGTAPALARDGDGRMRLYAGQQGEKHATCEAIYDPDSETWSKWRRIRSWARTISTPAPANVHGEINLMTQNLAGRLMEQGLE
jgi:hypothetical protein